jgi:hypothetical protein
VLNHYRPFEKCPNDALCGIISRNIVIFSSLNAPALTAVGSLCANPYETVRRHSKIVSQGVIGKEIRYTTHTIKNIKFLRFPLNL